MSSYPMEPEDVQSILSYLDPSASSSGSATALPLPPLEFLRKHFDQLPPSLLNHFAFIPPKQRTSIPSVKHRRLLHATAESRPAFLDGSEGRLRWPLMWERLGGDPFPPPSHGVEEEERWVSEKFMPTADGRATDSAVSALDANGVEVATTNTNQQVKKLGGFLRLLEEEREAEGVRAAKRMERRLDTEGEEFDEESDDEEENEGDINGSAAAGSGTRESGTGAGERPMIAEDQEEVKRVFEKRLLELFLDGLD
ncbi:hypothetical protein I317_05252, partial [Kwoniella heveanensis CBS 569]